MKSKLPLLRSQSGQTMSLPATILAVFVIAAVGVLVFEMSRVVIARDQLRTATEAAALAASAGLASSTNNDTTAAKAQAEQVALNVLRQNDILGTSMEGANLSRVEPALGQTVVQFEYLNPQTQALVPASDPNGKTIIVHTKHGLATLFGQFIGLSGQPVTVNAVARGGVGLLDVVLCFDASGSMDDRTPISVIRRTWNPGTGQIDYLIQSQEFAVSRQALPPQELGLNAQLRGATERGSAPGNFPPGTAPNNGFTDVVVNIDGNTSFGGVSVDGYSFPSVGALVEASHGNLENSTDFTNSQAATALTTISPQGGYIGKYFERARRNTHPLIDAEDAARDFFTLMNRNTDAHFGLVVFNHEVGGSAAQVFSRPNVSPAYPQAGNGTFPLPGITPNPAASNFNECTAPLGRITAHGGTNIGGALQRAVAFLQAGARPDAKKAIILFTDGIPTAGPNPASIAQTARSQGIPIFTVGLNLDPSQANAQRAVLTDSAPGGVAFEAGNGGKFFQVSDPARLKEAFTNIARHLTQLVH